MDYWAYCRVSTRKEEQEESLDSQEAWARSFAQEAGATLRVFSERQSAKTTIGRPIFNGMMADLAAMPKARRPKYLLVTALDRLSRSTRDTLNVIEALREYNVTIFDRRLGEVTATEFPQVASLIGMSLAGEAENFGRSQRMKQSWERRRAEGKPTSNKVPYGLQLRAGRDEPIPDSATWVLNAFQWYADGVGMYTIARRFAEGAPIHTWLTSRIDENGSRIKKSRPTLWESGRIRKLLEQTRYKGAIVPPALFNKVQERLKLTPKRGSRRIREYPLTAALSCEGCGRHFHGIASGGTTSRTLASGERKTYVRPHKTRYYSCIVCDYRLNADRLEEAFFSFIGKLDADESALRKWVAAPTLKKRELTDVKKRLVRLETECSERAVAAQRDRLFDLALAANISEVELRRQLQRLHDGAVEKRKEMIRLRDHVDKNDASARSLEKARELLHSFERLYQAAAYEIKRELVRTLAEAFGGITGSPNGLKWGRGSLALSKRQRR